MGANNHWSEERWDGLCKQLCADFGPASAAKIIETVIATIGGERITIPTIQDLQRRERDRQIWSCFRGDYQEIMVRFSISETTARRVILKQRIIERSREPQKEDD